MFPCISIPTIFTLSFLFSASLTRFALAQVFQPNITSSPCSAFIEGQGLYTVGGTIEDGQFVDRYATFVYMLDLSVSWNTSNPVFKQLENGPKVKEGPCTFTNEGKDLFVLSGGQGHVYNVESNSWTVLDNNSLASYRWQSAATDPETGIIYLPDTTNLTYSLDLRTNTVNVTGSPEVLSKNLVIWSTHLKSMVIANADADPLVYTPSKVSESSTGWSVLKTGPINGTYGYWDCGVSAYGGSKLVFSGRQSFESAIFTLDVATRTWRKGPPSSIAASACAVTGDQFIVWGADWSKSDDKTQVFVYNMKTEKWVSRYNAPPLRPTSTTTRTTHISQLPQTPTQPIQYTTDRNGASSIDMKIVAVVIVVAGILLTAINVYLGISKRSKIDAQRTSTVDSSLNPRNTRDHTDTSDKKQQSIGSSRRRDPSESGDNSTGVSSNDSTQPKWFMAGQFGRLHQGIFGARELSEHPHAILEDPTSKRNAQEGAFGAQVLSQHPHAMVGDEYASKYGDKVMHQSIRHCAASSSMDETGAASINDTRMFICSCIHGLGPKTMQRGDAGWNLNRGYPY
ncbi:MAG: hypothetical protein J3Q66DRAFT_435510 [Benniella sp.]|nr:MAG: hypothetical protein J3Q66DRAFT_435510 [Benniella sp.]